MISIVLWFLEIIIVNTAGHFSKRAVSFTLGEKKTRTLNGVFHPPPIPMFKGEIGHVSSSLYAEESGLIIP